MKSLEKLSRGQLQMLIDRTDFDAPEWVELNRLLKEAMEERFSENPAVITPPFTLVGRKLKIGWSNLLGASGKADADVVAEFDGKYGQRFYVVAFHGGPDAGDFKVFHEATMERFLKEQG